MKTRILTAVVGIPVVLAIVYIHAGLVALAAGIVAVLASFELLAMYGQYREERHDVVLSRWFSLWIMATTFLLAVMPYLVQFSSYVKAPYVGLITGFLFLVVGVVFSYPQVLVEDVAFGVFSMVYIGWGFSNLVILRLSHYGFWSVILTFVIVWSADSFAYFAGRAFGKHKMAPRLSPNKTWEGALGGMAGAICMAFLLNFYLRLYPFMELFLLTLVVSALSIIGDLFESYLKRTFGQKDSGRILPGHGGILDRFDAFLFILPLTAWWLPLLVQY